jgi:hypothetical protein
MTEQEILEYEKLKKEKDSLEAQLLKKNAEDSKKEIKAKLSAMAFSKNFPQDLIDLCLDDTEEKSMNNFKVLSEKYAQSLTSELNKKIADTGRPIINPDTKNDKAFYTMDDIAKMDVDEINKNWTKVDASLKIADKKNG